MLVMVYLRVPNATDAAPVIIPIGAGGSQPPYAAGNTNISVQLAGAKQVIEVRPAFPLDLGDRGSTGRYYHAIDGHIEAAFRHHPGLSCGVPNILPCKRGGRPRA